MKTARLFALVLFLLAGCAQRLTEADQQQFKLEFDAQRKDRQRISDRLAALEGNANANVFANKETADQMHKVSEALSRLLDRLRDASWRPECPPCGR